MSAPPPAPWHSLPIEEALARLATDGRGLSSAEAARRLAAHGANKIPARPTAGLGAIFLRQFKSPLIYLLLAAGAVSLAVGETIDAGFIFVVLLVNAVVGAAQERGAEKGTSALESLIRLQATVKRDGAWTVVDGETIAPGDLARIESGEKTPADLRLLSARELRADESTLSGESTPVAKRAGVVAAAAALVERDNMLFAGSTTSAGRGEGIVVAVGRETEIGAIVGRARAQKPPPAPLTAQMTRFTRLLGIGAIALVGAISALLLWRGEAPATVMIVGVALAVSAIPEGLPVAVTVALSVAVRRMQRRGVIARSLPAVEGLGACTLIASDKTGTLTENKMRVAEIRLFARGAQSGRLVFAAAAENEKRDFFAAAEAKRFLAAGAICGEAQTMRAADGSDWRRGDPVDLAFLDLAEKWRAIETPPVVVDRIGYEPQRRFGAAAAKENGAVATCVKGAPETVLAMRADDEDGEAVEAAAREMARDGLRVIAVARGDGGGGRLRGGSGAEGGINLAGLRVLGLAGIADPPRPEAAAAVRRCREAGVAVRMITGDHPRTALAIGRILGIAQHPEEVATGAQLAALAESSRAQFDAAVAGARIFARIEPTQKSAIVESMRRAGHVVAVTGDGVNDALALRAADIGVAMGRGGTAAAREAADLILTDDNFASIVAGIEEGRIAYDNIRKLVLLLVGTGVGEIVLFLLAVGAGLPPPLLAAQMLWLNMVTNGLQDVALAFEGGEPDVLRRPPRGRGEALFNRAMRHKLLVAGGVIGALGFGAYWALLQSGATVEAARNYLLLLMVLLENAHALNSRSERRSIFKTPWRANKFLLAAIIGTEFLQLGAAHWPPLAAALRAAPVGAGGWLGGFLLAAVLLAAIEAQKRFAARR